MTWTTFNYPYGSVLTSAQMTNLYNNFTAVANGDTGAPKITKAAMSANSVDFATIINEAVNDGSYDVSAGAYQVLPAGMFLLSGTTGSTARLEVYVNSGWVHIGNVSQLVPNYIVSDGVRVRVGGFGGTNIINYRRIYK